jgi:hypothetical protein
MPTILRVRGFADHELREIARILVAHQDALLAAWQSEEKNRGDSSGENPGS